MKYLKPKKFAISACLIFGLMFTGCGASDNDSSTDTASSQSVSSESQATEVSENTNETAASDANDSATSGSDFDFSSGVSDEDATTSIVTDGIQSVTINSHNIEEISDSEYGSQYIALDTVNATYIAGDATGILPQTVTKDFEFYLNKDTSKWEILSDTTTACEVDNSALPNTSWKYDNPDSEVLTTLFGDEISSDDTGAIYFHFLKRVGLFAFNLTNEKNTSTERFFTTVGTNGNLVWAGTNGTNEKSFSIANGSVTDSGEYNMEITVDGKTVNVCFGKNAVPVSELEYDTALGLEIDESKVYIDSLTEFSVTSSSIENGNWKTPIGLKEENISPELTWDAVDGASKYAIIMLDETTANRWLHWYVIVDKTHVDEGEFTDSKNEYAGPYPPDTHEYVVYVVALADDPSGLYFQVDTTGGDIQERLNDLNTKSDGTPGNVLSYGKIGAEFIPGDDYYGSR